jgi:hypothetical protein
MQNTFTKQMQALRTSLDATNVGRRRFLDGLRANVSTLRANSKGFLDELHARHRAATERMTSSLTAMREYRRELGEDLRRGREILRTARG